MATVVRPKAPPTAPESAAMALCLVSPEPSSRASRLSAFPATAPRPSPSVGASSLRGSVARAKRIAPRMAISVLRPTASVTGAGSDRPMMSRGAPAAAERRAARLGRSRTCTARRRATRSASLRTVSGVAAGSVSSGRVRSLVVDPWIPGSVPVMRSPGPAPWKEVRAPGCGSPRPRPPLRGAASAGLPLRRPTARQSARTGIPTSDVITKKAG